MARHTVYLAFGSNIGDGEKNIREAYKAISLLPGTEIIKTSRFYITEPWGYTDQPDFTNSAALIETELSPNALMGACLGIEASLGRKRGIKNGPRIIDIDMLSYDDLEMNTAELILPHPGMHTRDFVLKPLEDLL